VVLWRQPMPCGRPVRYVAVGRHHGAPPLAGRRARRAGQVTARALTPVNGDTLLASRAANLWRLDTGRLTAAVAHFAPGVRVIDNDAGQLTGPRAGRTTSKPAPHRPR
jgi:hypothetical protein